MYCTHCGKDVLPTANFCAECGTKVLRPEEREPPSESRANQLPVSENSRASGESSDDPAQTTALPTNSRPSPGSERRTADLEDWPKKLERLERRLTETGHRSKVQSPRAPETPRRTKLAQALSASENRQRAADEVRQQEHEAQAEREEADIRQLERHGNSLAKLAMFGIPAIVILVVFMVSGGLTRIESPVPQRESEIDALHVRADQGDANAQVNLGDMYVIGREVPQNYAEAARWVRLAAEQGHAGAQLDLGLMYFGGQGVPQDYVQAYMWSNLAASRMTGEERERAVTNRDLATSELTPADLSDAQRLAREWDAAHPR